MNPTNEDKQLGMVVHLASAGLVLFTGAFGWLPGLIMYMMNKDKSRFVAFHSLQSLIFQAVIFAVNVVLLFAGLCTFGLTWALIALISIGSIVLQVVAAVKANNGESYILPVAGDMARKSIGL